MGFAPSMVVCSTAVAQPAIRQNENKVAVSILIPGFLQQWPGAPSANMRRVRLEPVRTPRAEHDGRALRR
jgi:hypothetical protein